MSMRKLTGKAAILAAVVVASAMLPSPSWADTNITANVILTEDADWRDRGTVTIASGVTVDLNGHTLRVAAIAGAGSIIDSKSYELLDYVEATGAQRIPTGFVPGTGTSVDVVFTPTDDSPLTIFGVAWGAKQFLAMGESKNWYFFGNGKVVTTFAANTRYRFGVSGAYAFLKNDATDTSVGYRSDADLTNTQGTQLFICDAPHPNGTNHYYGKYLVYSFKVWQNDAMVFDLVPARNPATGAVGLLNRLDGTLLTSETATPLVAGSATGSFGIGALRVEASSEADLANFSGTIGANVRMIMDGTCTLSANANWKRFPSLQIDGTVELSGHYLHLAGLYGKGTVGNAASGDEYDRLDYVQSTGEQIVDTGIFASTDTEVELDFTYLDNDEGTAIFGGEWGTYHYMMIKGEGKFYFFSSGIALGTPANNTRYVATIRPGTPPKGTVSVVNKATGTTLGSNTNADLTNNGTSNLKLFGFTGRTSKYKLHSFRMWKGGELKRHLLPVKRHDTGKVGLLDLVTGEFFVSNTGVDLVPGTVVTSSGDTGKLHIDVADGKRVIAESLALTGSLKLVKEGDGTLTVNRAGQTYTDGNRVVAGVLDTMNSGGDFHPYIASKNYLGDMNNSSITVDSDGVFDFKGNADYRFYYPVLNGGTLRNSGHNQSESGGSLGPLSLTDDSTLETVFNTTFFDVKPIWIDLGGHTLTVDTMGKTLYFHNAGSITNGVLYLKGNGRWRINQAVSARGVSLRVESALQLDGHLDVENYYAACTFNTNAGTGGMSVYGRFTPATDYFYGCTLQDGAIIDLNGRNGAWSITSAFTSGANRVTFVSGATITVDVSTRPTFREKIVDWGAGNAPSGVTFRLDAASKAMGRALRVKGDGLYAATGVMIIVR